MKIEDQYLKFVRWSEAEGLYLGYCPDLFPWGGISHGETDEEAYHELCELVREEIHEIQETGQELPAPSTRPMREAVPV